MRLLLASLLLSGCVAVHAAPDAQSPDLGDPEDAAAQVDGGAGPGGSLPPGYNQYGCQWDKAGGPCQDPRPQQPATDPDPDVTPFILFYLVQ